MDIEIKAGQVWVHKHLDIGAEIVSCDENGALLHFLWDNTPNPVELTKQSFFNRFSLETMFNLRPNLNVKNLNVKRGDNVNSPAHYKTGGIEVFDFIAAKLTPEELRGYCKGNCLKYLSREASKGGVEDLKKAEWYLKKLIEIYANA